MIKCDVLVVGAGPAGCSAAFFSKFLDGKKEVILCESKREEHYNLYHRMCGEIVKEDLFNEITPLKKKFVIEEINRFDEHWPGDITISYNQRGFMVDRPKYQKYVISEFTDIGGVYKELKVVDVLQKEDIIKVKVGDNEFIETKYLIAADGANSIIRDKIYKKPVNKEVLVQYIVNEKSEEGVIHYYYDEMYEGNYKWVFPYGDKTKIGFPVLKSRKFEPDGEVIRKQARTLAFGGMEDYTIGNIAFVGDAAAQTNALSKGGIRPGIIAGKWAAEAIAKNNIRIYDEKWGKSLFSAKIVNEIYEIQKKMTNKELSEHIRAISERNVIKRYIDILFKYRKYWNTYKAYEIANKVGW